MDINHASYAEPVAYAAAAPQVTTPSAVCTPPAGPFGQVGRLPNFYGQRLVLWDWSRPWAPSEWGEPILGAYQWRAANAVIDAGGLLRLRVTEKASGQVQQADTLFKPSGSWAFDVTVPPMRPGLVASAWLYNRNTEDEIDFEFVGKDGLRITVWTRVNGVHTAVWDNGNKPVVAGDLSNRRFALEVSYDPGRAIAFYVDGRRVATATPGASKGGHFPKGTLKAYLDNKAVPNAPGWTGPWVPASAPLTMTVHGFAYCPKL